MKKILGRLYEHATLDRAEARAILLDIAAGAYNDVQITAFTTVFNLRPIHLAELQGFRDALVELCVPLDLEDRPTIDIVGTGGDGKNTFNISTLSSVVVAGAGYLVSKHGSYGVSSNVGSSDVLVALGYEFTNDQDRLRRQLDAAGICFLHAPLFHPALKAVVPVRRQLGTKTFFNILGPLVNPAQPPYQLFGTFSQDLFRVYQYLMQQTSRQFAIVHALDGYDEISLTGPFKVASNRQERVMQPRDWQLPTIDPLSLDGGATAEDAARIFLQVLDNQGTPEQQAVVIANAGLAIQVIDPAKSMAECLATARESLESGRAKQVLARLLEFQG